MPPSPNNNFNENEVTYFLLKQVQEQINVQLKEVIENSKKTAEQVQEIRIEMTKLNSLKTDLDNIKSKIEELEKFKKEMEQVVTIEDLKAIKRETNSMKKFQVQAITIATALYLMIQIFAPLIISYLQK